MRFGLRTLLVVTALFAVLCWLCSRWPVTEQHAIAWIGDCAVFDRPPRAAEAIERILAISVNAALVGWCIRLMLRRRPSFSRTASVLSSRQIAAISDSFVW